MKRVLAFLCAVTMVLTMCSFTLAPTPVVVGTVVSPKVDLTTGREVVEVSNYSQLKTALTNAGNAGKTVKLTADIDLNPGFTLSYDEATGFVVTTDGTNTVNTGTGLKGTTAGAMTQAEGDKGLTAASEINIQIKDNIWLDGDGHTISGFYTETAASGVSQGILHTLNANNKVANLNIKNSLIVNKATGGSASYTAGFLAIWSKGGEVYNCHVEDSYIIGANSALTNRSCLGGLIGQASGGNVNELTINDNTTTLEIQRKVLELNFKSDVVDSCSYKGAIFSNIPTTAKKTNIAGGIVGNSSGIYVTNCANYADVIMIGEGENAQTYGAGGIIGCAEPVRGSVPGYLGAPRNLAIVNCANYGDVTATVTSTTPIRAGALVGFLDNYWATNSVEAFYNCFNSGKITCADTCKNVFIGTVNGASGSKVVDGDTYKAAFTGKAAYLYSVDQNGTGNGTGNGGMTEACIYIKKALDDYGATLFGESTILGALNAGSMPFATRKWIAGEDGMPTLDYGSPVFGSEANPRIISTAAELKTYRDAYNGMNYAPEAVYGNVKLGADIDLNPGYTFELVEGDAKLAAGVEAVKVTNETTVYNFGLGGTLSGENKFTTSQSNGIAAGGWYNADWTDSLTAGPELYEWVPFTQVAQEHLGKIKFDGDGHTISGVFFNKVDNFGFFGAMGYNLDVENLTLDGFVFSNGHNAARASGMFVGEANWDTYLENCVNAGIVSTYANANYGKIGGVVGYAGVARGSGINSGVDVSKDPDAAIKDFNSIAQRIARNRRNRNMFLACGNKGVVVGNNPCGNLNLGGVIGYTSMIEAYLCYNEGQVVLFGNGSTAPYGLGGVVGGIELGTNITKGNAPKFYITVGADNTAAPLPTVVQIIGCYNSGRVYSFATSQANMNAVIGRADGSWGSTYFTDYIKDGDGNWVNSDVLQSRNDTRLNYNFQNNTQGTTKTGMAAGMSAGCTQLAYVGSTKVGTGNYRNLVSEAALTDALSAVKKGMLINEQLTKAGTAAAPTLKYYLGDKADKYVMWIDYTYENGGGLKVIKNPGIQVLSGATTTYVINTPEALALVNETASYAFGKVSVQIGDTVVNNINEAKVLAASLYKAGTGKVMNNGVVKTFEEDTTTSNYTCISNAAIYYMNQAGALGTDKNVWPTTFKDITLKLGADIDMTGYTWKTMYNDRPYSTYGGTTPDYCFKGIFEGNNKTISGITVNPTVAGDGAAIFGAVNGGSIQNLTVANSTINGGSYTGGLMTYFSGGTVQNVKLASDVTVTATAGNVGGLIAWRQGGTVKDCENAATINAAGATVGGIIGNDNQTVTNCKNTGNITATGASVGGIVGDTTVQCDVSPVGNINEGTVKGSGNVGGIYGVYRDGAGRTPAMSFDGCKNKGTVIATGNTAGGIIGSVANAARTLKLENCVNEGTVTGAAFVGGITGTDQANVYYLGSSNAETGIVKGNYNLGGITGQAVNSKIENCTNAGLVTIDKTAAAIDGHDIGGIAGHIKLNTVIDGCTNTGKVVGTRLFGGIFGDTPAASVAELQSSTGIVKNCKNLGTMETVAKTADGDSYYVGGIGGQACIVIENCENTADVTAKRLVGGIAGRADKDITNCTNKGNVVSTGKGAFNGSINAGTASAGGIVSDYASNNTFFRTISGCVNEGDVSTPEFCGAGGIATNLTNSTITDCTNKGEISGTALIGGIVAYATSTGGDKPTLITKCTNEGAVHSKNGNTGGIIGWKNQSRTTVAYCINKGTVTCDAIAVQTLKDQGLLAASYSTGAVPGGIIGTLNAPTNRLTSTLYGNVNLGKVYTGTGTAKVERPNYGITSNGEGYWAYNFSIGATGNGSKGAFLVDGKVVDDTMMRSGLISAIINNINFKEEDFLQKNLWKAANGHYANGADLLFWGTWTTFAEGSFVQPDGFESGNVMFIDENGYPTLDNTAASPVITTGEEGEFTEDMAALSDQGGTNMKFTVYNVETQKLTDIKPGDPVPANSVIYVSVSINFYTAYGASMRKTAPSGLRFETFVESDYRTRLGIPADAEVVFGTIILPKSYTQSVEFTAEGLFESGKQLLNIEATNGFKENGNMLSYASSVVNVKDIYREYVALSYMKVINGQDVQYYTAAQQLSDGSIEVASVESNVRSVNYVAKQVIENEAETEYAPTIWNMLKSFAMDKTVID